MDKLIPRDTTLDAYYAFVRSNPRIAAEVEAIVRWSSYLIGSKKSPILGEVLMTGANLLQLCNDIILRQANPELKLNLKDCATQLKTFLTVIQSVELLAEIYARDNYGSFGKWAIITVIQVVKATIKLVLVLVFEDGLTKSQSVVPLDRIQFSEIVKLQERFSHDHSAENILDQQVPTSSKQQALPVVLRSSGRKMRSIKGSTANSSRSPGEASPASSPFTNLQKKRLKMLIDRYREHKSATLSEKQLYGEILHITRPLAHLALMGSFGTQSWISYFTSFLMDVSSLYLVRTPQSQTIAVGDLARSNQPMVHFNCNERMELGHRASSLIFYLLRSPFFDDYTKQKALEGLATSVENVPLIGQFIATFINYIPEWQKDYFRVWSE